MQKPAVPGRLHARIRATHGRRGYVCMRALVHPAGPSQARCRRPGLAPRAAHRRPCRSRAPPERSHTAVCRPARARTQRRPAAARPRPRPRRAPRRRVWHPSAIFAPQICRASRAPSRTCAPPRHGPRRTARVWLRGDLSRAPQASRSPELATPNVRSEYTVRCRAPCTVVGQWATLAGPYMDDGGNLHACS